MNSLFSPTKPNVCFRLLPVLALVVGLLALMPIAPGHAAYSGAQYGIDFDGTDDYVYVPDDAALDANLGDSFTVEAWVRTREDADNMIFAKHSGGSSGSYYLATRLGGKIGFTVITSNGRKDHEVSYAYNDGKWHHVAGVYNGSDLRIYVDGVLTGGTTAQLGSVNNTSYDVRIGYYDGSPDWFYNGIYDEIRLWDDARTAAEIRANMYRELSGSEAGLVAYYKMSDGSGTTLTDNSGHSHTGTLVGGPAWLTSGAFAGPRNALDFDGVNDFVDLGNPSELQITGNLTIEAWFSTTLTVADYKQLVAKWYSGGESDGGSYVVGWGGTGLNFGIQNTSHQTLSVSSGAMWNDGEWHHVAGTWDGTTLSIYVDGSLKDSATNASFGSIENTSRTVRIGSDNFGTADRQFIGQIDAVRIWNTARTPAQIRENMFRTLDGDETGLVVYYRFDQYDAGDQTTLYNLVGDSCHGTLTNMEATSDWVSSSAFNTWIGDGSTDWSAGSNWSSGSVPAASDNVGIYTWAASNQPSLNTTTTIDNLVVGTGAALSLNSSANLTVSTMDFVYGSVSRSSGAVSQENRSISTTGVQTYGLADGAVDIQSLGSLASLQAGRIESQHPNENANGGGANILNHYYTFTPTGSGYAAELCLGYTDAELGGLDENNLHLCRWTGSGWSCPTRGVNSNTSTNQVCADGVTTFSDWVIGEVGPTVNALNSVRAQSNPAWLALLETAALLIVSGGWIVLRKRIMRG